MRILRPFLLATLLAGAAAAEAAVVGPVTLATMSFDETYTLGLNGVPSTAIDLKFSYSFNPGGVTDPATIVFDGRLFTAADAGGTFELASAADDPQLPAFLARATNGVDDDVRDDAIGENGGGVGLVSTESARLFRFFPSGGPDLGGHRITSLELFIAELAIDPAAGTPHWHVSGELRFVGQPVPLPGGLVLFTSALVGACGWRRRRARPLT